MKANILMAMLVAAVTAVQAELTPSQIAKKAFPSTVLIVTQDESGQPLSIGSGFFVEKGVIATNFHVIEGASSAYARLVTESTRHTILGLLAVDQKNDLALLKTGNTTSPPLNLSTNKDYGVGEAVYSVGNPKGLEGTFASGIISGVRKIKGSDLIQITAPISPGSSGGPILNKEGLVIGVAVATYKSGQNLNFAVPVKYAEELIISSNDTVSKFSSVKKNRNTSVTAAIGSPNTEGIEIKNIGWDYPDNDLINHYSFSIKNNLNYAISDFVVLIIFETSAGQPVDYLIYNGKARNFLQSQNRTSDSTILPKLTRRFEGKAQRSTVKIARKFSYRILNFRILDQASSGADVLDF